MADGDVTKDLGPSADHHAVADFRMAVTASLFRTAKGDVVEQGYVVPHHGGLADHQGVSVVDEEATPQLRRGMQVEAKDLAHPHLNEIGQIKAFPKPKPMGQAVRLKRLVALEVEEGLHKAVASGVQFHHRGEVRFGNLQKFRRFPIGLLRDFPKEHGGHFVGKQLGGEAIAQGLGERAMMQHAGVDEAAHEGLTADGVLRFLGDSGPEGVRGKGGGLDCAHDCAP